MAKHYHVFGAAEACKRCWLGVGAGLSLGPSSAYSSCQEAGFDLSQPGMGGGGACGRPTVDVITPALSTTADICLTRALPP